MSVRILCDSIVIHLLRFLFRVFFFQVLKPIIPDPSVHGLTIVFLSGKSHPARLRSVTMDFRSWKKTSTKLLFKKILGAYKSITRFVSNPPIFGFYSLSMEKGLQQAGCVLPNGKCWKNLGRGVPVSIDREWNSKMGGKRSVQVTGIQIPSA